MPTTASPSPVLRPRSPGVDLDAPVPRHWFGGNVVATHVANGVNLLFPAGERFFVRSVNHYLDRVQDPHLRAQIKGFFAQEGRHAREHERVFRLLEEQGYDVERPASRLRRDWRASRERAREHDVFRRGIREYLRPGFHPSQKDTDGLASTYLASVGLA
jgi:predicted metal-dependent hydrolase